MPILKNSPLKANWRTEWFPVCLIFFLFLSALGFYLIFPDQVAIHWNLANYPDRYAPSYLAVFLMPVFSLLMYFIFLFIPSFNSNNYIKFTKTYYYFRDSILVLLALIYFFSSLAALDYLVNVNFWLPIFIATLFVLLAKMIDKFKLSSWPEIAPRLTSQTLIVAACLMALLSLAPSAWYLLILILAIASIILPGLIYFLILYNQKKGEKEN